MKQYKTLIAGLIFILLLELTVFNFSTLRSLGAHPFTTEGTFSFYTEEDGTEVLDFYAEGFDEKIRNLYFDIDPEIPQYPVRGRIFLTDEGNAYEYEAGSVEFIKGKPAYQYVNLYPYGKVRSLHILFYTDDQSGAFPEIDRAALLQDSVKGITANAKRPLFFNIGRVLILSLFFAFFCFLRGTGKYIGIPCDFSKKQRIITLIVLAAVIGTGLFLTESHKLFNEAQKPHHAQYKELAEALKNGEVKLPYEASEGLLSKENPYDTISLQAEGIEYRADYAYYNGSYYVYFGIVPELLLYYPYHLLTKKDFPNHAAVFVFFALFAAGIFLFYDRLIRLYFKKISFALYLILSSMTVLSPTFAYVLFTADLYSVPIMAGLCFTAWGLALYLAGLACEKEKRKLLLYALGSLSTALVAGARPQMLLFGLLAIPLFLKAGVHKKPLNIAVLLAPYVAVAVLVMYYNAARFGSVFDFGATYSLTNNDMTHRGFSISRILRGLFAFLFALPGISGEFPFITSADLSLIGKGYVGKTVTEYLLGGVMIANVSGWILLLLPRFRKVLKGMGLLSFTLISLFVSLIIGAADTNTAGILQRYSADLAFGILVASCVMIFMLTEFFEVEYENIKIVSRAFNPLAMTYSFAKISFALQIFYALFTVCNTASGITLRIYNPELFFGLRQLFMV